MLELDVRVVPTRSDAGGSGGFIWEAYHLDKYHPDEMLVNFAEFGEIQLSFELF